MCIGTETKCPICGSIVIQSGKGKPKEYCSESCRNFQKYLDAMERELIKIKFNDSQSAKLVKSDLWRKANIIVIPK